MLLAHSSGLPAYEKLFQIAKAPGDVVRAALTSPLVAPPGLPQDRVALLRKAFLDMAHDPDFQADALAISEPVGYPIDGARLAKLVAESVAAATPEVVEAYQRLTGKK